MKRLIGTLTALLVCAATATAADNLDWAYPATPQPEPLNNKIQKQVPGSPKKYTQAQIDDPFNPPDWFPNEHPAMPEIVAHGGQRPAGRACAQCHLPSGDGHPESASLAGLNANYIVRQMAAFKNGDRKGVRAGVMIAMEKVLTEAEVKAAADYFASLKPTPGYNKVIEADKVPATYVGPGGMRFALTDGVFEPVGNRIIALPQNAERAALRDPKSGFTDFVAKGSTAKGAALAAGGDGKTVACTTCHGPDLKGLNEVPGITGRSAIYIFRQLNDMKTGNRSGGAAELMKLVVTKLDQSDMIALAAYLGSRDP